MNSNSSVQITVAAKGDTVCRPSGWTDVAKFFLLNFGLHAMTVVTPPGSGLFISVKSAFISLLLPFIGTTTALNRIIRCTLLRTDPLRTAAKASALCMVLREEDLLVMEKGKEVSPALFEIHGQHPVQATSVSRWLKTYRRTGVSNNYRLVLVPDSFDLRPILGSPLESQPLQDTQRSQAPELKLSSEYNFIKGAIAIFQILYGSFGLYQERGNQIEKYGYAAYSLTVVPYILMSITNLFAAICQPRYPCKFLVLYRGPKVLCSLVEDTGESPEKLPSMVGGTKVGSRSEIQPIDIGEVETAKGQSPEAAEREEINKQISGAVGQAYGDLLAQDPYPLHSDVFINRFLIYLFGVFGYGLMAASYIILYLLSGFRKGQSTVSQRGWIMAWLVLGQVGSIIIALLSKLVYSRWKLESGNSIAFQFMQLVFTLVLSVGTIGGFVTAAKMILADQVCVVV